MRLIEVGLAALLGMAVSGCVVHHHTGESAPPPPPPAAPRPPKAKPPKARPPKARPPKARPATPPPATPPPAHATPHHQPPKAHRPELPPHGVPKAVSQGWVPLGRRDVQFRGDHDTIPVGADKGRFVAMKFTVSGSPLEMYKTRVTFGNDQIFEPRTRHVFDGNDRTRRIDFPGGARAVKKVEFWYRSVGRRTGKATVQLFAQKP